jgi:hypothetical protein
MQTMEFDQAKEHLKALFAGKNFSLVDEHAKQLYFRHSVRDIGLLLEEQDILLFSTNYEPSNELENEPFACSIRSNNYVELLLIEDGRRFSPRFYFGEEGGIDFRHQSSEGVSVRIGYASHLFIDYFLQKDAFEVLFLLRPLYAGTGFRKLSELQERFITAQVQNLQMQSPQQAYSRASPIVNACLFTLAYMRQMSYQVSEDWPQRPPSRRPFRYTGRLERGQAPIPQQEYDENLVRLYQRGVASTDPVVQFLSFYQVLEYHFMAASNADLFKRLAIIIGDPAFRPTAKHLNRLAQQTLSHKRDVDETEMLKLVLLEYTDESELLHFVERYEYHLGEKVFSKAYHMFGKDVRLTMQPGHIISSVARRIKHFRNALVHAADRFEGFERYIPSRSNEDNLVKEIPVVRFLAERAIIGSGRTLA